MEPLDLYARTARYRWWIPLAFVAVALATAILLTSRQTPEYQAAATAAVVPSAELEAATEVMRGLETLERRTVVATFAMVAEARETRDAAIRSYGDPETGLRGYSVNASVVPNTNIIRVTVTGPSAEGVARLANALIRVTETEAREMYRIFGMRPLQAATPPRAPIRPTPRRNYVVATLLGLFAGVIAAIAVEYLWPSRRALPLHAPVSRSNKTVPTG